MGRDRCDATAHVSGSLGAVQRRRTDCCPSDRAKLHCREQWRVQRWQRLRELLEAGVVCRPEVRTENLRQIIALATWILAWALGGRARKRTGTQQRQKHARKSDEQTDENAQV